MTTSIDAVPIQCLRVGTPTFKALLAAVFTGGVFIFATYHWWWAALVSGVLALGVILNWLWTGTAEIPEKPSKEVGHGLRLPLYASGSDSVGWWAMFIAMLGNMTAFVSLVFGYLFYWTIHEDFPPIGAALLDPLWVAAAAGAIGAAWLLTIGARRWNKQGKSASANGALGAGAGLAIVGAALMIAMLDEAQLDPTSHVHPAMVSVLCWWVAVHVAVGVIMQFYCAARLWARRMSAEHDIDLCNVTLYWHFVGITAAVTLGLLTIFAAGGG